MTTSKTSFIKDSKIFVENIIDDKLSDDKQFVRFCITDMYFSLPKYDWLLEIKNRITDNNFLASIDKCSLIELAILSLEFISFTINQKYYNQKQGLFIVAPTSPCSAEVYYTRIEENHTYTMLNVRHL